MLFVYRTDLRKKSAVFHNFARQIALSHVNIQEARGTRFPCTTNHRIDHIIKLFHEKNSTISGLFSKNNLLLCGTQGNNGLLAKTFENFSKSPIRPAGSHFWPSAKNQSELSSVWKNMLRTRFTLQFNKNFINMLIFLKFLYVWYTRHFEYSCMRCSCTAENNGHSEKD